MALTACSGDALAGVVAPNSSVPNSRFANCFEPDAPAPVADDSLEFREATSAVIASPNVTTAAMIRREFARAELSEFMEGIGAVLFEVTITRVEAVARTLIT
jgi:hypothetical protein